MRCFGSFLTIFIALSISAVGCGGSDPDTGDPDSGGATDGGVDTSVPTDTGTADTGTADTGTADTGTADTGTADTGTPDTTPPSIVATSPAHEETGVLADVQMVIEFSKPMNRANTQAAYQSASIPAGSVTFSWNTESTEMTVTPNSALAYAVGTDPLDLDANEYGFQITTTATDTAGNPLPEDVVVTFTTLRHITQAISRIVALTGTWRADGNFTSTTVLRVGDSGSAANAQYKGFISYDISTLPEGIVSIENATAAIDQSSTNGTPYEDLGGVVNMYHAVYDSREAGFSVTPLGLVGVLSDNATVETKSIGVTAQVTSDYENRVDREDRSQYRLEFPTISDFDGVWDSAMGVRFRVRSEAEWFRSVG